jgi:hypothetical protein
MILVPIWMKGKFKVIQQGQYLGRIAVNAFYLISDRFQQIGCYVSDG